MPTKCKQQYDYPNDFISVLLSMVICAIKTGIKLDILHDLDPAGCSKTPNIFNLSGLASKWRVLQYKFYLNDTSGLWTLAITTMSLLYNSPTHGQNKLGRDHC